MFVSAPARMWKRRPQVGAMRMYDKELRGANARHARSPRMSRHRILKASFSRGAAHFPRHQCCGRAGLSAASPTREISSRLSSSWTMVFPHAWMGRSLWRGVVLPNDEVAHCRAFQSPSRPEASQTRGLGRMPAKMGLLRTLLLDEKPLSSHQRAPRYCRWEKDGKTGWVLFAGCGSPSQHLPIWCILCCRVTSGRAGALNPTLYPDFLKLPIARS